MQTHSIETPDLTQTIALGDGKYTFRKTERGGVRCDRYGEAWRDFAQHGFREAQNILGSASAGENLQVRDARTRKVASSARYDR